MRQEELRPGVRKGAPHHDRLTPLGWRALPVPLVLVRRPQSAVVCYRGGLLHVHSRGLEKSFGLSPPQSQLKKKEKKLVQLAYPNKKLGSLPFYYMYYCYWEEGVCT